MNANCYQIVYKNHGNPKRPSILLYHKWNRDCRPFRSSPPVFTRVRVAQCLVFCVAFCISLFILFYFYYIVCPSLIYGFWLLLWYLQASCITELWYMPNIPSPEETLNAVLKCKQKKLSNYIAMYAEGLYYMYVIENNELKSTLYWQKIIFRLSNNLMLTKDCIYIYIA
jgi:hypothetical protein